MAGAPASKPRHGAGLRTADIERALSSRPCARSEHFVLHHVVSEAPLAAELSTDAAQSDARYVEDRRRFGTVVPKRHARRAVTRNLIKRQGRAAFASSAARLSAGDWLLRLRSAYSAAQFPSAASGALRTRLREELRALFASACEARPSSS